MDEVRTYATTDRTDLWTLKQAFERELGGNTGGESKERVYEAKLTDEYRDRYLAWVDRCVSEQPQSIMVAECEDELVGYIFVLPESMAMIWDAGVINELFVVKSHRGTGIADALMERALTVTGNQDLPLDRVVLDVDEANERAQAFYDRHGFEPWGELVARKGGRRDTP